MFTVKFKLNIYIFSWMLIRLSLSYYVQKSNNLFDRYEILCNPSYFMVVMISIVSHKGILLRIYYKNNNFIAISSGPMFPNRDYLYSVKSVVERYKSV